MYSLNCGGQLLLLNEPRIMGILNLTPDSFYAGNRMQTETDLVRRTEIMLHDGADIIDIGAQSTRPESQFLSADEEWARLAGWLPKLCARFPKAIFSIDTFHAAVARRAVDAGVRMVNDVSGGQLDPAMLATVGELKLPYVCMHMRGTPQTMQAQTQYDDLVTDICHYFTERIGACRDAGIGDLVLDPGFGFSKTIAQNFELLRRLGEFQVLGYPLLLGVSRKSSISKTLGVSTDAALNGTTVLNTIGLMKGANVLRVHDVKEAKEVIKLKEAVMR